MTKINNEPIREVVLNWLDSDRDHTWSQLSKKLNWTRADGSEDVTRVKRCLGLTKDKQVTMNENIARDILLAIGEWPGDHEL